MSRILIVDDEKNIVTSLKEILTEEGFEVAAAGDGLGALEMIQADPPDLVLLDIWLPGMDGIEVLKTVKTYHPEIEVLIMSGHGTIDTAVKATKLGAHDFIEKPFSLDHLTQSIHNVFQKKHATNGVDDDKRDLPLCFEMMVEVKKAALQAATNDNPILVLGEKGTGKEFIAHAIHKRSPNSDRPFVQFNCALREPQEIQSHLFADPAGQKTGKAAALAREAAGRVLYLSNIESLSPKLQKQLADTLEKGKPGEFLPVRLFASSSKDLQSLAAQGKFSAPLLKIFEAATVRIPPLREYTENIPAMVQDYFEECAQKGKFQAPVLEPEALEDLCQYSWPENVKELRSVLDQILVVGVRRGRIRAQDLPAEVRRPRREPDAGNADGFVSYQEAEQIWEKGFLIHHLRKNNWDLEKTCRSLKTDVSDFKGKMKRHAIRLPGDTPAGPSPSLQRTLKRSVVLCGSGLHSGIKTGLILQPLPPGSGIIFGDISTGQTVPARLENVRSTDYSTCLKKGLVSVATIEHIMAVLHMYRITNLLIKIGDEVPVMDGSAKDFCELIEDGEFEEQDGLFEEIVIDETLSFGPEKEGGPYISIEPSDKFKVSYHMEYPEPIGKMDYTYEFNGEASFKEEIAPARTFGFLQDVAQLTKMGFASGGKLDNFILLGDGKVINTKLRFDNEFVRHKILDILGDFYLLGKPLRGHIKAHKSGHTQNVGLLNQIQSRLAQPA